MSTVIKVNLNDETLAILRGESVLRGQTITEVLHQMIHAEARLVDEARRGSKVLIEDVHGKLWHCVYYDDMASPTPLRRVR